MYNKLHVRRSRFRETRVLRMAIMPIRVRTQYLHNVEKAEEL